MSSFDPLPALTDAIQTIAINALIYDDAFKAWQASEATTELPEGAVVAQASELVTRRDPSDERSRDAISGALCNASDVLREVAEAIDGGAPEWRELPE